MTLWRKFKNIMNKAVATHLEWPEGFRVVYDRAVGAYEGGKRSAATMFSPEEVKFLASIGCSPQELFDLVEDYCSAGEPGYESVLLMAALRREYFLGVQKGVPSGRTVRMSDLPLKTDALAGIPWLPRIIEKAKAKLRGEMPPELMYGCGGDRPFLRGVGYDLADFLKLVWESGDDRDRVVRAVLERRGGRS